MKLFNKLFNHDTTNSLIAKKYRAIATLNNCAPTAKTSDKMIVEIYKKVFIRFNEAAAKKGEFIPSDNIAYIALMFMQIYESSDEKFLNEHYEHEMMVYNSHGLRKEYAENKISLFI